MAGLSRRPRCKRNHYSAIVATETGSQVPNKGYQGCPVRRRPYVVKVEALGVRLRREYELELNPWAGIHTGPAVVETGEDAVSMVGEARNVAVRLEDVAGRMWAEVCVPPDDDAQHTRFQAALAAGAPITHLDAPLLLRDGDVPEDDRQGD